MTIVYTSVIITGFFLINRAKHTKISRNIKDYELKVKTITYMTISHWFITTKRLGSDNTCQPPGGLSKHTSLCYLSCWIASCGYHIRSTQYTLRCRVSNYTHFVSKIKNSGRANIDYSVGHPSLSLLVHLAPLQHTHSVDTCLRDWVDPTRHKPRLYVRTRDKTSSLAACVRVCAMKR